MNRCVLFISLFVSYAAAGQLTHKLVTTDYNDVQFVINTLLSSTINKYELKEDTLVRKRNIYKVYSSGDKILAINFYKDVAGANDLDKEGTTHYYAASISGYYKDLFNFWKKNFQPDADLGMIAADGHAEVQQIRFGEKKMVIAFARWEKDWQITFDVNRY